MTVMMEHTMQMSLMVAIIIESMRILKGHERVYLKVGLVVGLDG
jgi:hypothetical protein